MVLDIGVVVLYLAAMLLLGWYGMRRAKTHEDFLVAGRNLGPGFYMGTMAATVLGGASTVGTVRLGYVYGISGFWLCAMLGLGIIVLNVFLAKPLLKLRIFTVTQILEYRYSARTKHVSALVMMAYALMLAATSVIDRPVDRGAGLRPPARGGLYRDGARLRHPGRGAAAAAAGGGARRAGAVTAGAGRAQSAIPARHSRPQELSRGGLVALRGRPHQVAARA